MDDLSERIGALSVVVSMWPLDASPSSAFAHDEALSKGVTSFDVSRNHLLTALRRLRDSHRLWVEGDDGWGTHLFMMRPALVLCSKAAWIVRSKQPGERAGRALGVMLNDQRRGATAMRLAVSRGALSEFERVALSFDQSHIALTEACSVPAIGQDRDESMIHGLGSDVDDYYGTADAVSQMQLVWNAASSLAHGETWFQMLTGGMQRGQFADVMSAQSFDVLASAINVTALRILTLASDEVSESRHHLESG